MKTATILLLLVLAAACSSRYEKRGITQAQADQDSSYCAALARGGGGVYGGGLAGLTVGLEAEAARYKACMLGKGYRQTR